MAKKKKMSTMEIEGVLQRMQTSASGSLNSSIGNYRSELMKRYLARPYGDEVEGKSTIVDTAVKDTVESIKPELMDIFFGGDAVVQYAPTGPEDTQAAEQENAAVNHIFMKSNDGFMVLYNWFHDALTQKNGYVKRYWDERKEIEIEEYDDLTPDEALALVAEIEETSDEVEILERSGGVDEETGESSPMYIRLRRTVTQKEYKIESVPPEEVLIAAEWTKLPLKQCPFHAHKRAVTVSDLIAMGFDRKMVEELGTFDKKLDTEEANTRHSDKEYHETDFNNSDSSMREVLVYENYAYIDRDGDGIAELLQIFTGGEGGKILKRNGKLSIEEIARSPFNVLSPLPIPHKHYGICPADLVLDIAKLKTVMTRQLVDNLVGSQNPDLAYDEDMISENTVKALSTKGHARNIPISGGPNAIAYMQLPDIASQALAGLEYVEGLRESRTGVTRYNQGLDAESLNKTASGIKQINTASMKKILLIARIFAETGVKDLFVDMHYDLRSGPIRDLMVELDGQYTKVNPRTWRRRTDVTVNVGLGSGDREAQLMKLQMIYAEQKEAYMTGKLTYDRIYHTLSKMLELSGYKDANSFFLPPEEMQQMEQMQAQQPKPPGMEEIMFQIEKMKVDQKAQSDMLKNQTDRQKNEIANLGQENRRLDLLLKDMRERDLKAAEIEAQEALAQNEEVDGEELTEGPGMEERLMEVMNAAQAAAEERMMGAMQEGQRQLMQAMTAPKEVIRDENGRPIGVRTVKEQMN